MLLEWAEDKVAAAEREETAPAMAVNDMRVTISSLVYERGNEESNIEEENDV